MFYGISVKGVQYRMNEYLIFVTLVNLLFHFQVFVVPDGSMHK